MFNFLNSCGFCSSIPHGGDFAYEIFNKVPTVGGIFGNLSSLAQRIAPLQNIISGVGGFSSLIGNQGQQKGQFDLSKFANNLPSQSLIAGESTFKDLVGNNGNGVVKKILKSNYNELNKEHTETGQKFTDPDFPPDKSSLGVIEDLNIRATWKRITDIIKNAEFVSEHI